MPTYIDPDNIQEIARKHARDRNHHTLSTKYTWACEICHEEVFEALAEDFPEAKHWGKDFNVLTRTAKLSEDIDRG
jgi:hypothetical protein